MLKLLKSKRGEGYIDIVVIVLVVVMVLSLAVSFFPVLSAKAQLDTIASELCREAEIAGRIGIETTARLEQLKKVTGLNVYASAQGGRTNEEALRECRRGRL